MIGSEKLKTNEKRAICGICAAGCWVIVTYDPEGKIQAVRADETSPLGAICKVGRHSPEIVYSKDRLRYPLKRKGLKGSFAFQRTTWEEAYALIVERLQAIKAESGPEATAIYTGSGSFELAFCDMYQPKDVAISSAASVLFPFGSPNTLGVGALCYVAFAMIAPHVTMGRMFFNTFSDIEQAELILIWGKNPAAHCPPHEFYRIQEVCQRGAALVVIDPRKTVLAKYPMAEWLPIRPGTDGALALGLCQVLIEEDLYNEDFVKNWTVGFEEFARYAQHFRPEVVENITGLPAEKVRSLARRIATASGVSPVMYSGLEYSDGGVQAIRATLVLWALAGQLDRPGGSCFSMAQNQFPINREGLIANPNLQRAAGFNNFPIYTKYRGEFHANILPEAVLKKKPYPIRLLLSLGASIITSWPQSEIWRKTLAGLDFLVCIDRQLTADMAYADIVLPATTYYEIESYMRYGPLFRIREPVIGPVGEARSDFFILAELARRLGYGHLYPQNSSELLDRALQGSGFTVDAVRRAGGTVQIPTVMMQYKKWEKGLLREDGQPGFETPSGKFEIASSILEEHGYEALPKYVEPGESPYSQPGLAAEYPLVFNSGARSRTDIHTLHQTIPALGEEKPVPTVMINTADARARKIEDGDPVYLRTPRGQILLYAMVSDDIVAGAVEASAMGGGALGSKAWQEACINDLTDLARYDPISGFPVYKALLCQVAKIPEGKKVRTTAVDTPISSNALKPFPLHKPSCHASGVTPPNIKIGTEDSKAYFRIEPIYLDHNATTPMAEEVKAAVMEAMEAFGNPSSLYAWGKEARLALEKARRSVALLINTTARRIIFTGGGSEANNLAIKGIALSGDGRRNHLITSAIEHPSVLQTCRQLERQGFHLTVLPVDTQGRVNPQDLESALTEKTGLISIMTANNETGAIQPVAELAALARTRGIPFHTDAVQALGKLPLDVNKLGVDLLTFSGHKFYGPKGIGVLYVRKGLTLDPLIAGGHQEMGLRAGTENIMGILGLGRAAELAIDYFPKMEYLRELRDRLQQGLLEKIPGARLNGHPFERLPNTLNLTLPGIRGESLVLALDRQGIAISSGSACQSGFPEPSQALTAMGLTEEEAHCTIRISLGLKNTAEEIDRMILSVDRVLHETGEVVRFVSCR